MKRLTLAGGMPDEMRGGIVALGNFDGFHLGHQAVVGRAIQRGFHERRRVIVATFASSSPTSQAPDYTASINWGDGSAADSGEPFDNGDGKLTGTGLIELYDLHTTGGRAGNISTRDLCALIERNLPTIEAALQSHTLVEIDRLAVTPVV